MTLVKAPIYGWTTLDQFPRSGRERHGGPRKGWEGVKLTVHGNSTDDILTQVLLRAIVSFVAI